jgi:hypothetical protein
MMPMARYSGDTLIRDALNGDPVSIVLMAMIVLGVVVVIGWSRRRKKHDNGDDKPKVKRKGGKK